MIISTVDKPAKFESWILASRPKTLLAAVVPVMVGSALAVSQNQFIFVYSFIALICSILIQVGTNFANDLYDHLKGADSRNRKGPERALSSGLITSFQMKIAIALVFSLAFVLGLYLVYSVGILILVIGVLSIAAGLAYTAGPYPLAYNGLGDVFVFVFFGIIGTAGTYYLHLREFTLLSLLISLPVGVLITNILVINNYRDIDEDREANKNTLVVKLGKRFARIQIITSIILSYLILFFLYAHYNFNYWIFLPLSTIPIAYLQIKMLYNLKGMQLNKTLELSAKYAALFGLLFSAGMVL
jgi:1,4-dihydroxy-2-naphthoate polyprenyltransferase